VIANFQLLLSNALLAERFHDGLGLAAIQDRDPFVAVQCSENFA